MLYLFCYVQNLTLFFVAWDVWNGIEVGFWFVCWLFCVFSLLLLYLFNKFGCLVVPVLFSDSDTWPAHSFWMMTISIVKNPKIHQPIQRTWPARCMPRPRFGSINSTYCIFRENCHQHCLSHRDSTPVPLTMLVQYLLLYQPRVVAR